MAHSSIARPAIITVVLLLIPLVMTLLDRNKAAGEGWAWGPVDFILMGALLFGAGWLFEVLAARTPRFWQKAAIGAGILACVGLIWAELAVDAVSKGIGWLLG